MSIIIESKLKPGLGHNFCNILSGLKYVNDKEEKIVYINNVSYNLIFNNPNILKVKKKVHPDQRLKEISNNVFYKNLFNLYFKNRIKVSILKEIKRFYKRNFDSSFISIAIRSWNSTTNPSTNNRKAVARSNLFNLNKWIEIIDSEEYKNNKFFVTVDNNNYKDILKKKFGDRVLFYERKLNKTFSKYKITEQNLIYDFVEIYLLSKNSTMIGTKKSGFFLMATLLSNENTQINYY